MIIYNFIKYAILNIKYTRMLNKIYKDEQLLSKLSDLLGVELKKDWIGRMYTIINPLILSQKDELIFEYNNIGTNYNAYIEKYIMTKLNVANEFIYANNLFEILTYKITKIDDYENYLFVMQPITLDAFFKYSKKFFILALTILGIIGIYIAYKFLI